MEGHGHIKPRQNSDVQPEPANWSSYMEDFIIYLRKNLIGYLPEIESNGSNI